MVNQKILLHVCVNNYFAKNTYLVLVLHLFLVIILFLFNKESLELYLLLFIYKLTVRAVSNFVSEYFPPSIIFQFLLPITFNFFLFSRVILVSICLYLFLLLLIKYACLPIFLIWRIFDGLYSWKTNLIRQIWLFVTGKNSTAEYTSSFAELIHLSFPLFVNDKEKIKKFPSFIPKSSTKFFF